MCGSRSKLPSRRQLTKAGEILRHALNGTEAEEALALLGQLRSQQSLLLPLFHRSLLTQITWLNRRRHAKLNFRLGQRIKRLPSILAKLQRFPQMQLARMQDIGGLRLIVDNPADVEELYQALVRVSPGAAFVPAGKKYDYIKAPKPDGYRSLHQVFKYQGRQYPELNGICLELQIRTRLQHLWATAVEMLDFIEQSALKSGAGAEPEQSFFKIMSALFSLKEQLPVMPELADKSAEELCTALKALNEEHQIAVKLEAASRLPLKICGGRQASPQQAYYIAELAVSRGQRQVSLVRFAEKPAAEAQEFYLMQERQSAAINAGTYIVMLRAEDSLAIKEAYPNLFLNAGEFLRQVYQYV